MSSRFGWCVAKILAIVGLHHLGENRFGYSPICCAKILDLSFYFYLSADKYNEH